MWVIDPMGIFWENEFFSFSLFLWNKLEFGLVEYVFFKNNIKRTLCDDKCKAISVGKRDKLK